MNDSTIGETEDMGVRECTWEDRIEAAAKRGAFDAEELVHVRHCADCRALTAVIELLGEEGRAAERQAAQRIPSARVILARARAAQSSADVRRVLRPILWVQRVVVALAALLVIGVGWWLYVRAGDLLPFDQLPWTVVSRGSATPPGMTGASMVWVAATVLIVALYGAVGMGRGRTRGS